MSNMHCLFGRAALLAATWLGLASASSAGGFESPADGVYADHEPMAGMSRPEKERMVKLIRSAREQFGASFLLLEHDIPVIMDISDHVVVLDFGRKIAEGRPEEIRRNEAVISAYLGAEAP